MNKQYLIIYKMLSGGPYLKDICDKTFCKSNFPVIPLDFQFLTYTRKSSTNVALMPSLSSLCSKK
jgi:hypothetical protein